MDKEGDYDKHSQIDLIIEKNDGVIHLVEAKFHADIFRIDDAYRETLLQKLDNFSQFLKRKRVKSDVRLTLISFYGTTYSSSRYILPYQNVALLI